VQLTSFVTTHGTVALVVLALILAGAVGLIVAAFSDVRTRPANVLDRIALGGLMLVGVGLLLSPTYYYHYGGFMAPFVALAGGAVVGRFQARIRADASTTGGRVRRRHTLARPTAWLSVTLLLTALISSTLDYLVTAPPSVLLADNLSDAIPAHGCVVSENPTVALLDNRFTSDVPGCPDVIDWLGQERVLDNGLSASASDTRNVPLPRTIRRWLTNTEGVVAYGSIPGWGHDVKSFLLDHFTMRAGDAPNTRVYVRDLHDVSASIGDDRGWVSRCWRDRAELPGVGVARTRRVGPKGELSDDEQRALAGCLRENPRRSPSRRERSLPG
jgi:hypothetical protein